MLIVHEYWSGFKVVISKSETPTYRMMLSQYHVSVKVKSRTQRSIFQSNERHPRTVKPPDITKYSTSKDVLFPVWCILSQSIWRRRNLLSSKQMDWRYCLNVQLRWPYMTTNIELNDAFELANVFDWHILERKWAQFSLRLTVRRLTRQCILKLSRKRRALMNGCRQVDLERSSPSLADVLCGLSERLR